MNRDRELNQFLKCFSRYYSLSKLFKEHENHKIVHLLPKEIKRKKSLGS